MKHRCALLLTLLALLLLVGIPTGLVVREYRRAKMNRDLITAILEGNSKKALTTLGAGADPNAHLEGEDLFISEYPTSPALILALSQVRVTPDSARYQIVEGK